MKRLLLIFGLAWLPHLAFCQYGNEWINYSQTYYKVPVAKTGIYRLSYNDMAAAGVPIGSVDPRRIQLFHRGVEQAVIFSGQADSRIDPGDYLEFYGQQNDGTLDQTLYKPSSAQPHPYYNLYSDTTVYFLTWSATQAGRRIADFFEVNAGGLAAESYHQSEILQVFAGEYSGGYQIGEFQQSFFDVGEGWTDAPVCVTGCSGSSKDYTLTGINQTVQAAGLPELETLVVGRYPYGHHTEIYVGPDASSLRLLTTLDFNAYDVRKVQQTLSWGDVSAAGNLVLRIKALGVGGLNDFVSLSYIKLVFPQQYEAGGQEHVFHSAVNAGGKSYLTIANAPSQSRIWDITEADNPVQIGTVPSGALLTAIVPSTDTQRTLYLHNQLLSASLTKVHFRLITPTAHNFLFITHPALMKPALGYSNPVKEYAGYRHSAIGGGYDTLVVTMDQLQNQFNYGERSPRAIFQFVKFMVEQGAPRYMVLVGKGLDVHVNEGAVYLRHSGSLPSGAVDFVPSAGLPGSDMLYSAGLAGTLHEPALPVGRLSVTTSAEVASYLNKVMQFEQTPFNALWRKDLLHLSGGIATGEPALFRSYMDGFAAIARGPYLGGAVATRSKSDPSTVQFVNVSDEINKGVELVTFYGHSSPGTIDIDIGNASDPTLGYNNAGKYPVFLINGCNAGNFFRPGKAFGEDWMSTASKGARNFIAHSSFGDGQLLEHYSRLLYQVAFADSSFLMKGIGDVQREVARRFINNEGESVATITQAQQMVLLGDPSLRLFGARLPDWQTDDNAVFIASADENPVTALSATFLLKIIVRNFGRTTQDSLHVHVARTLFNNAVVQYDSVYRPVDYEDTIVFRLPRVSANGFGNNQFVVTLDYPGKVKELDETNNSGRVTWFFARNGTRNIFPAPFSIVTSDQVQLLWQSSDLLSDLRDFTVQVDTVATFDSPYLQQATVNARVVARHLITMLPADSIAYYWRTRLSNPAAGESTQWEVSSFTRIFNGPEGWTQGHRGQFADNLYSGLAFDPLTGKSRFVETVSTIYVHNYGSANPADYTATSLRIDGVEYNLGTQGQPCRNNTLNLLAFDRRSTSPYAALPFDFQDPRTCGREPQLINSFELAEINTGNGDDVSQWVDNVHASDSVLLFTIGDAGLGALPATIITKLNELGISAGQLASLQAGEPVVIFGRKGAAPGTAVVRKSTAAPANAQDLQVNETITGRSGSGTITSTLIGPASAWGQLALSLNEITNNDQFNMSIAGVSLGGTETSLMSGSNTQFDLSSVDPLQFPMLRLKLLVADDLTLTPVQLKRWLVSYTPVAEGLLFYAGTSTPVSLQEGQTWSGQWGFTNLSTKAFADSLRVQLTLLNSSTRRSDHQTFRIQAPAPSDTTLFVTSSNTKGRVGDNDVQVVVNPQILAEQYYENNQIDLPSYLHVDRYANQPVLDVLFDGRYILDGEIVSPDPAITIRLKDGNRYLFKTDTTGMSLFLTSPGTVVATPVYFRRADVKWFPASTQSDFRIEFNPKSLADGIHTLQVKLSDASGNTTGSQPFTSRFEVVNESAITNFYPYPNPFSTHTRFVFTLTGTQVPDQIRIQIMTVSGKVVREITQDELGPVHVGNNISNYAWDGRDEFGDQLANGVYLYRVVVKSNGSDLGRRSSAGDKGFEKGYGKLYLLR
ncbi:MAG: hypothetical protein K1X47_05610 [Cyclobacteriaceae bacterium]|nr:hypothetical protein [Cyclobacteriaceae bacterium]